MLQQVSRIDRTVGPDLGKESGKGSPFDCRSVQRRNSVEEEFLFESNGAAVDQIVELDVLAPRLGLGKRASGHCSVLFVVLEFFEIEARAVE